MNGAGQIPLSAIRAYMDDVAMDDELERELFKRVIMTADNRRAVLVDQKRREAEAKRAS